VSTILIDIFGTREDLSWRADRCSRTKNRKVCPNEGGVVMVNKRPAARTARRRVKFARDSSLEETVLSELVSEPQIPW
jgi:hypothetical protein